MTIKEFWDDLQLKAAILAARVVPDLKKEGSGFVYAGLSFAALVPLLNAVQTDPANAWMAIGGLAASLGGSLLADKIKQAIGSPVEEMAREIADQTKHIPELVKEMDAVLEKLDIVPAVEKSLGEKDKAWFLHALREDAARVGSRYVQTYINIEKVDELNIYQAPDPKHEEERKKEAARRLYLEKLWLHCQSLPLTPLGWEKKITLNQVYIDLDTTNYHYKLTILEDKNSIEKVKGDQEKSPMKAFEAFMMQKCLVLLGDPGSGKSTFVKYLLAMQAEVCKGERAPFLDEPESFLLPVLVTLRELGGAVASLDFAQLSGEEQEKGLLRIFCDHILNDLNNLEAEDFRPYLKQILHSKNLLLVLDGLDEVPQALLERVQRMALLVLRELQPRRTIVTCRVRSYFGEAVLPDPFRAYTLADLDEDKIRKFCEDWYRIQHDLMADEAAERANDLVKAALKPDLGDMACNPMRLTIMAIVHNKRTRLPNQRVKLYKEVVEILLQRWQEYKLKGKSMVSKELESYLSGDINELRKALEYLAYQAYAGQPKNRELVLLQKGETALQLRSSGYFKTVELAEEFLNYVDQRSGLLIGQGGAPGQPVTYSFPHRTFQEYLAGSYLTRRNPPEMQRELFQRASLGSDWRVAVQFALEELLYNRENDYGVLDAARYLREAAGAQPVDEKKQRALLWSGVCVSLLGKEKVEKDAAGKSCLEQLTPGLIGLLSGKLPPNERAEAGVILGRLGDPRPEVMTLEGMPFCFIPGGEFLMGDKKNDKQADTHEKPQHKVHLDDFWISQYPVTQSQFNLFVNDKGYANPDYWSEACEAGAWKKGHFLNYNGESRDRPKSFGEPFDLPNHPVMDVAWYQALAFCRWLGETAHAKGWLAQEWKISLPSEAEWEKAARGGLQTPHKPLVRSLGEGLVIPGGVHTRRNPQDDRAYPWGIHFSSDCCNSMESGIGSTSTPGCFRDGASEYAVQDLSGNVWEWTRSIFEIYPYPKQGQERDKREDLKAEKKVDRVLRGGSFNLDGRLVRCAYRVWDVPGLIYWSRGFRVVVLPK
jgi:formylglycine-generating enzyme required for sulfatase activity